MVAVMASSVLVGGGGGLDLGTVGFLSPKDGKEKVGSLGKVGRSMTDWETSSVMDFLGCCLGGGVVGSFLATAGSSFFVTGSGGLATTTGSAFFVTGSGVFFTGSFGFSGSEGGVTLSLNPGMKSPVVDASVSNSSSSSSFFVSSSLALLSSSSEAAADRHTPFITLSPSMMHLRPNDDDNGEAGFFHATAISDTNDLVDTDGGRRWGVENPWEEGARSRVAQRMVVAAAVTVEYLL
mmetsp:Transcript_39925/g.73086  ORF Transcript_39925/g.73086 Transcript_39925/m.73086 type:complete len:237 (-) Transcript_39925:292-1002(-)